MNSDSIFLCASWSFAYGKEKSVQANLVCVRCAFWLKWHQIRGGEKPGHCDVTAQKLEDMKMTVYGGVFSSGRCQEDFNLLIYLNLPYVLITKISYTLYKIQKSLGHRSPVLETGSHVLPNFTHTHEHIL